MQSGSLIVKPDSFTFEYLILTFINVQRSENVIIEYIGNLSPINDFRYLICVLF